MTAPLFRTDGPTIYTPPCLLRWPALDAPKTNKMNPAKKPQYEATFVLMGAETCVYDGVEMPWLTAFKRLIDAFCVKAFGRPVAAMLQELGAENFVLPVKPNTLPNRAKHAGIKERPQGVHFAAATQYPLDPVTGIVDLHGRPMSGGRIHEIYDGCMAIGAISMYDWKYVTGRKGIGFNLIGIQKVGDGPRLGGATASFTAQQGPVNAPGFDPSKHFAPQPGAAADGPPDDEADYPTHQTTGAPPAAPTAPATTGAPPPNSGFAW